ncbi:hypothetical protein K2Z84_11030 [Candidatus Binatia bacterium]|nr:hypothetical protein [Candidatus Binatia bacterium]
MPTDRSRGPAPWSAARPFAAACLALGLLLVGFYVWLAHAEYFFGDDFVFLRRAQQPRDWAEVFVSFRSRGWWSYRPLSIEVFFSALNAVAGTNAFPYLLTSLAVHFATGALVYRIALQLGIEWRVAIVVGLLKVAMYPSLNGELFWASAFQTVLGTFFYVLAVSLFLDYLTRDRRPLFQIATTLAMLAALLSNELAMTLPGPLVVLALVFGEGDARQRIRGTLRACAPMIVLLGIYLPFRYVLIGASFTPTPPLNLPHLGWHVPWNVLNFVRILGKRSTLLVDLLLAIVVAGWACAAWARDGSLHTLARRVVALAGWLLCAMVPYLGMYFLHHRAAIVLEAPFCLLVAAHLDPIVRRAVTPRATRVVEVGLIALLVLAFPYQVVGEQARVPRGKVNRDLLDILAREPGGVPDGACVRLQTRPEDSWLPKDIGMLRFATGLVLAIPYPNAFLEVPVEPGKPQLWRQKCSKLIAIEVLHGPADTQTTFVLRRAAG